MAFLCLLTCWNTQKKKQAINKRPVIFLITFFFWHRTHSRPQTAFISCQPHKQQTGLWQYPAPFAAILAVNLPLPQRLVATPNACFQHFEFFTCHFFPQERNWFCQARQDLNPQLEGGWGGRLHWVTKGGLNRVRGEAAPEEGGRSMFKFTATVEKQAERAAVHPPDVHSLALIRSWQTVKWTEQGPPWGGLQQHSTCPILGVFVLCAGFLPPPFSFSWYKIHCNLVLWNTLNSEKEKKKTRRISILAPLGNVFVLWCNLVSDICCKCKTEKEGEWKKV